MFGMGKNERGWSESENDFTLFRCEVKIRKEEILR